MHEWFSRSVGGLSWWCSKSISCCSRSCFLGGWRASARQLVSRSPDRNLFYPEGPGPQPCAAVFAAIAMAIEQLDLSVYPLVLNSNHLLAKGYLPPGVACQLRARLCATPGIRCMPICICAGSKALGPWIRWQLHQLRQWMC